MMVQSAVSGVSKARGQSDEELMAAFQQGDQAGFAELVRRFKDPLTNFVFRVLGNREDCYDVVQDTFLRVFRSKHTYKPVARFSTWVYTIALNLARTELRRKRFRSGLWLDRKKDEGQSQFDPPDDGFQPDVLADSTILDNRIQAALQLLDEKYRTVIVLRDIQDLPYEEIAAITGANLGTVKSRINRGRTFLQEQLKDLLEKK
jgi:RNA polymerase sigma-70 factor (ECF subfamily)